MAVSPYTGTEGKSCPCNYSGGISSIPVELTGKTALLMRSKALLSRNIALKEQSC